MLRRFLYLDEPALDGYLSALEDGLRTRLERVAGSKGTRQGALEAKVVKASGGKEREERETSEIADTPHSRFSRLLQLVDADPEAAAWIDLPHLGDLADAGYGALVSAECEIYVPDIARMLGQDGGAADALTTMIDMLPMAERLGLDVEGVPSTDELQAMSGFMSKLSSDSVFVGEDDESDWKVAGKLASEHLKDSEIDGYVRVVGKVAQRWPENRWKPLLALPGASLLPRKERKVLESKAPSEDDADQFLEGPAVMLDVLAIYR